MWTFRHIKHGTAWTAEIEAVWEESFRLLEAYKETNGDCNVPQGSFLGAWVKTQRIAYRAERMPVERIARLVGIEFDWRVG